MGLKQAIIIRSDLGMSKGKMAGQCAHASVSAYVLARARDADAAREWEEEGQKKIVLKVGSEEELLSLYERMKREMPCALIRDAGKTQLEPGTITCFGAGPAGEALINKYTKELKLL
ncbi:MAG: peptidyl-tRNA hydrolase Pth2 [Candidatus Micrarchaeota archaeon]|nr:peptidyl-tRNA hydrolase Pth2 [Candidatus Micrarchaeota archaeon]